MWRAPSGPSPDEVGEIELNERAAADVAAALRLAGHFPTPLRTRPYAWRTRKRRLPRWTDSPNRFPRCASPSAGSWYAHRGRPVVREVDLHQADYHAGLGVSTCSHCV